MSARQVAASLAAAFALVSATPSIAADLYGDAYSPPDDYEESYSYDREDYRGQDYAVREREREYEYRGSTKDDYAPPPPRYGGERYDRYAERGCLPPWKIKRHVRSEGWSDLRPIETEGRFATVRARSNDSGRLFTLKVDDCSGEIVHVRPHYLRTYGFYEPRPWERRRY